MSKWIIVLAAAASLAACNSMSGKSSGDSFGNQSTGGSSSSLNSNPTSSTRDADHNTNPPGASGSVNSSPADTSGPNE
jgi:hypothetical protein